MRLVRDDVALAYGGPRGSRMSKAEAVFLVKLGHDLRSMYTDVLGQPVPDDLASLLDRIDNRDRAPNRNAG